MIKSLPAPIVIIDSVKLDNISGTSKKTGNPFSIYKQEGYLVTQDGQRFPDKISFLVDEGKAYSRGDYHINFADSLDTDSFDGLIFKRLTLTPITINQKQ